MSRLSEPKRLVLRISGAVQGVGFRPFVYRLAQELNLVGWVNNSAQGVVIEVEGNPEQLKDFLARIESEKPPNSLVANIQSSWLEIVGYSKFEIRNSVEGKKTAVVLPDLATCEDCLKEIFDPNDRRYCYPFANCTNCGPRYSIIEALPYDRPYTAMKAFQMCPQCQGEYQNPLNRRFHAQPNACPQCGPGLELWDGQGKIIATHHQALLLTAEAIKEGKIVALKGLGGFHLIVAADNWQGVNRLRKRKHRPDKPFALMYPHLDLVKQHCEVSDIEAKLLSSPQAPIVLLKRRGGDNLVANVASGNSYLGIMLPYTPLHHLLMAQLNQPIVATSGNLRDEPICTDEEEAKQRLGGIADLFLVHNRPIVRPLDDSIARVINGKPTMLRRARGYAPLPLRLDKGQKTPKILAVGGQLKNTIAIFLENQVFLSQHIGDLGTPQAYNSFENTIASLQQLYEFQPEVIACDAHPDYLSSQYARSFPSLSAIPVQHHHAHVLACMAENQILGETVLGVAWDGTGYGLDGTIWGGEFILISPGQPMQRVAQLRPFPLFGGEKAVREPRRIAIALLYQIFGEKLIDQPLFHQILKGFSPQELQIFLHLLKTNSHLTWTSSIGRLFDGVAAILNLCQIATFEGQAAMMLEQVLSEPTRDEIYPIEILANNIVDWQPIILPIVTDLENSLPLGIISTKFHNTLVGIIIKIAEKIGIKKVALTGGCFQNKYLAEKTTIELEKAGFEAHYHSQIPPNDGGIALGQIVAAALPYF
jgi:hydrogenase maturation protein HypF